MSKNTKKSTFQELIDSIHFYFDSKRGRYSLETYLQIISKYVDSLILSTEKEGMKYLGGDCKVKKNNEQDGFLSFHVEMFFEDINGNAIKKEAHRNLKIEKFTKGTINLIGNDEKKFNIDKPEGKC